MEGGRWGGAGRVEKGGGGKLQVGERRGSRSTLSRGGTEAREALLHPTPPYLLPLPGGLVRAHENYIRFLRPHLLVSVQ